MSWATLKTVSAPDWFGCIFGGSHKNVAYLGGLILACDWFHVSSQWERGECPALLEKGLHVGLALGCSIISFPVQVETLSEKLTEC